MGSATHKRSIRYFSSSTIIRAPESDVTWNINDLDAVPNRTTGDSSASTSSTDTQAAALGDHLYSSETESAPGAFARTELQRHDQVQRHDQSLVRRVGFDSTKEKSHVRGQALPHLDQSSAAHMISVRAKPMTQRVAVAVGKMYIPGYLLEMIQSHSLEKGDVLSVARIAAIQGAKKTSDIIPLCHSGLGIEAITVDIKLAGPAENSNLDLAIPSYFKLPSEFREKYTKFMEGHGSHGSSIQMGVAVQCTGRTGVEMEALSGVALGMLTMVDMCKSVDKSLEFSSRVVFKSNGKKESWTLHEWKSPVELFNKVITQSQS